MASGAEVKGVGKDLPNHLVSSFLRDGEERSGSGILRKNLALIRQ
jgi:hypothetical protein